MNYLDLFSGCGGFRRGLEKAGYTFEWEGHSEIDKYAKQIYEKHYPESEDLGDVRTIRTDELPKIDLITFGFPCQDLSVAGKRGGLGASRSGLFFEAMRIIRDARPDYFIFENVKGLFSSNGGLDWLNVLREVADSGYDGQWQLLNTRWFLPQNRERIYFVGHPRGTSRTQIFPIGESLEGLDSPQRETQGEGAGVRRNYPCLRVGGGNNKGLIADSLQERDYKGGQLIQRHPLKFLDRNQKDIEGDYAFTLDGANTGGIKISEATKKGYAIAEEGDSINLSVLDSKTRRGRVRKGEANTLDTGQQQYTIQSLQPKGMDGIIPQTIGGFYASTQESDTIKILSALQEEIGTQAFTKWGFGILDSLQEKKILQQDLHGSSVLRQTSKEKSSMDDSSLSRKKIEAEVSLRDMWERWKDRRSPQEPRLERQFIDELAETLQKLSQQSTQTTGIRRLTPLEAERLQGFPDGWTEGISDTQRYKMLGNAVTVDVVEAVVKKLDLTINDL